MNDTDTINTAPRHHLGAPQPRLQSTRRRRVHRACRPTHRNPAALARNAGHWRGLDDLEIATCGWVEWFNEERIHGELDDLTPAEVEAAYYRDLDQADAA